MSKLSVVLPAYNEELMVGKTCRVLAEVLTKAKIPYELVVVNDGSGDRTWTVTCSIRRRHLLRCTGCGRKAMK